MYLRIYLQVSIPSIFEFYLNKHYHRYHHTDNTARLQTVTNGDNSLYHRLITEFYKLSKIPMVLNTSFNRKGMPIVETPEDALQSLLACNNDINSLFMGNFEVVLRPFPFTDLDKIKVFIHVCICMFTCIFIYICTCIYIYIYIYVYIYAYLWVILK
jgi:hypothetical protein